MSWLGLWSRRSDAERRAVAYVYAEILKNRPPGSKLGPVLCQSLDFRSLDPLFESQAALESLGPLLARMSNPAPELVKLMFRGYYDVRGSSAAQLATSFHEATHLPRLDSDERQKSFPRSRLKERVEAIIGSESDRDGLRMYLDYYRVLLREGGHSEVLEILDPFRFAIGERSGRDLPRIEKPLPAGLGFTQLDRLLAQRLQTAIRAWKAQPDPDSDLRRDAEIELREVQDQVEELIHLSSHRPESYFHQGYLHAFRERDLSFIHPEGNIERAGWYLAGALTYHFDPTRTGYRSSKMLVAAESFNETRRYLLANAHPAAGVAVRLLLHVYSTTAQELQDFLNRLHPEAVLAGGELLWTELLDLARDKLDQDESVVAGRIIDLLRSTFSSVSREGDLSMELLGSFRRLRIKRMLQKGSFSEAESLAEQASSDPAIDSVQRELLRVQIGLARSHCRSGTDLRIPEGRRSRSALADRLESGLEHFAPLVPNASTGVGEFCLGVHAFLTGKFDAAREMFERSRKRLASIQGDVSILLPRSKIEHLSGNSALYLAVAYARCEVASLKPLKPLLEEYSRTIEPGRYMANYAERLLVTSILKVAPSQLSGLLAGLAEPLKRLLERTIHFDPDRAISQDLVPILERRVSDGTRFARRRVIDLAGLRGAGGDDHARLSAGLDLALEGVAVDEFLADLQSSGGYPLCKDLLVDRDFIDVAITSANVWYRNGQVPVAVDYFERAVGMALKKEHRHPLRPLLQYLQDGLARCGVSSPKELTEALSRPEESRSGLELRVYVITQTMKTDLLRDKCAQAVKRDYPGVSLEFFPGDPWIDPGGCMEKIFSREDKFDAIISIKARTTLGELVRERAGALGIPWRSTAPIDSIHQIVDRVGDIVRVLELKASAGKEE